MDEFAFREILSVAVSRPCPFERSILRGCAACNQAKRLQIAEREAVMCQMTDSHSRCQELYVQLRRSFSFALGVLRDDIPLPHAQEMRVQCGGLKGLHNVLNGRSEIENVDGLLARALEQWGEIADIPYSDVVHSAASVYKGRHN